MANVRFFRITTLPQYNPTWRGSFLYLNQEYAANSLIIGYPLIFDFNSDEYRHNSPVVVDNVITNQTIQAIWGGDGTNFGEPARNDVTVDGTRYFCYFDSLNQIGYICWGEREGIGSGLLYTITGKIQPGLWFGGKNKWELLTNEDSIDALDADTFQTVTPTENNDGSTTLTFNGIYEQDGIIHQGNGTSTASPVTIGDGALRIKGSGATQESNGTITIPNLPNTGTDVHSANDVSDETITLDNNTLIWDDNTKTISVRTTGTPGPNNLIVLQSDIDNISGAMHLIGAVSQESELPTPTNTSTTPASNWNDGDTWIVTGNGFTTAGSVVSGWNAGIVFEPGDTIVYLGNSFRRVQGNLTVGLEIGQVVPVSNAQGNTLSLAQGETSRLVATDGNGLIKTSIDPDNILSGAFERTQALSPTTPDVAGIRHSILSTDTISIGSTDKERHIVVASTNTSISIDGSYNDNNKQTDINVDLVWRESIS